MAKIHGNGIAPFRFLTPFPPRPSRRLRNSALKHVTSYGCPYSPIFHQIDLHVLKHTRRPISSASLGGQHRCGETMLGGSKGVCPLGRRTQVREGEAASAREQASVGRGKAERFPLQGGSGKAKSSRSLLPFPCILPTQSGRESINKTG
jgi:hypothetical protein